MPDWFDDVGAGTWPDWFAAVGTVGTLAVAVMVLWRETGDRRRRDRAAQREQARRVRLRWHHEVSEVRVAGAFREGVLVHERWVVENGSDEPIFDVDMTHAVKINAHAVLADGEQSSVTESWPLIGADHHESFHHTFNLVGEPVGSTAAPDWTTTTHVRFTDLHDQRWERDSDGRLRLVSEPSRARWWRRRTRAEGSAR